MCALPFLSVQNAASILYAEGAMKQRTDTREPERARLPLVGAQISTAGGFAAVPQRAVAIEAEVVQIFNSNPRTWRTRSHDPEEMAALTTGLRRHRLPLFFHTIYLINLASPDQQLRQRSGRALADALITGALAGAAGVVTHVGSHRGEGFESAIVRVVDVTRAATETAQRSLEARGLGQTLPQLLLETSSGSGMMVGGRLQELAALLTSLPVGSGLCLDTAHLFAAGYPVHEADGLERMIEELHGHDLLGKVRLVHLNDSMTPFASKRDRHQNPGAGQIGYDGLARVVRHPALARVPFILEVPGQDGHGPDAASVALVKSMREGAPDPRGAPPPGARPTSIC
jgi:deoxyribonuclease IV